MQRQTVGLVSSVFTLVKACSCSGPHSHVERELRSCRRGCVSSTRLWENFPNWFVMPMKRRSSEVLVGAFISTIVDIFSGSALIPFSSMMCPKNFSCFFLNSHLSGLRVAPADWIRLSTPVSHSSCSLSSRPNIRISMRHRTPLRPERIVLILF